jgi:hypothetical protein
MKHDLFCCHVNSQGLHIMYKTLNKCYWAGKYLEKCIFKLDMQLILFSNGRWQNTPERYIWEFILVNNNKIHEMWIHGESEYDESAGSTLSYLRFTENLNSASWGQKLMQFFSVQSASHGKGMIYISSVPDSKQGANNVTIRSSYHSFTDSVFVMYII